MRLRFRCLLLMTVCCPAVAAGGDRLPASDGAPAAAAREGVTAHDAAPPADAAYRIGPGDLLALDVWQEPAISGPFRVGAEGRIEHPLLGPVEVKGRTTDEVAAQIQAALREGYLKRPRVSARLLEFRSFRISVVGGVKQPGIYYLRGKNDLFSAVLMAGGFDSGMPGAATILRFGKAGNGATGRSESNGPPLPETADPGAPIVLSADLGEFARTGNVAQNPVLEPGDLVVVPGAGGTAVNPKTGITVVGEVKTPGVFEATGADTVMSVVLRAGGPTEFASRNKTRLFRSAEPNRAVHVDLADVLDRGQRKKDILVKPGDLVVVPSRLF